MASEQGKLSEVGTPQDAAAQALQQKYERGEKAKASEAAEEAEGKSGLDDAKKMIQEDFDAARTNRGQGHAPPGEQSQLNTKAKGEEHETSVKNLVKSAQDKLERDDPDAAHESLGTLQQAKREIRPRS